MPKTPAHHRSIASTVAIAFLILIAGFVFVWFYQQHRTHLRSQTVYSKPTRVVTGTGAYSVAVSFAIQTNGADAGVVTDNQPMLEQTVKQVLVARDLRQALAPNGMQALQTALRDACNAALHTDKVQQVVITDFLLSSSSD